MPDENNEPQPNVFLSWSGTRSQHVAHALRNWLPKVLQAVRPFISSSDIEKGSRGLLELAKVLEVTKVGIICLTPENLSAKWILFEAGALSKTLDKGTRVCTYLLAGLRPQDVEQPLGEFQATRAEKQDTRKMVHAINKSLGLPVSESVLNDVFDALWPQLEQELSSMPQPDVKVPPTRPEADMVAEILDLVRAAARERENQKQKRKFSADVPIILSKHASLGPLDENAAVNFATLEALSEEHVIPERLIRESQTSSEKYRSMEKRVRCTNCDDSFEVVGEGQGAEVSRSVNCPYCRASNTVMWPKEGNLFARQIPGAVARWPRTRKRRRSRKKPG